MRPRPVVPSAFVHRTRSGGRRIDRHVPWLRGARALDFGLVIAGRESLAVTDLHPVEAIAEEAGGKARIELTRPASRAIASRRVGLGPRRRSCDLTSRTTRAERRESPRRFVLLQDARSCDRSRLFRQRCARSAEAAVKAQAELAPAAGAGAGIRAGVPAWLRRRRAGRGKRARTPVRPTSLFLVGLDQHPVGIARAGVAAEGPKVTGLDGVAQASRRQPGLPSYG